MDILDAEATPEKFYMKEKSTTVFGEALRRFVAGGQVSMGERLDVICRFLMDKGYLADSDLIDAQNSFPSLRGLHSFFGFDEARCDTACRKLIGRYVAMRRTARGLFETSFLSIDRDAAPGIRIEEIVYTSPVPVGSGDVRALKNAQKAHGYKAVSRSGWIVQTDRNQTLAFLREPLAGETEVYSVPLEVPIFEISGPVRFLVALKHTEFGSLTLASLRKKGDASEGEFGSEAQSRISPAIWEYERQGDPS